uniref:Gamma-secretase subunit APH-1 n=1 Tax=Gopherus agassizii TaxID=38772 RepID=A0A452IFA9_9SAUR
MTAAVFIGCSFIAFGPALALCVCTIAAAPCLPHRWVLCSVYIAGKTVSLSCFFKLVFQIIYSISMVNGVCGRVCVCFVTHFNTGLPFSCVFVCVLCIVSGLGFAIMSGVFSLVNILTDSLGPGTVGIYGDSPQYFLSSAFMTLAIVLLHVFWGIAFFDACEKKKWWALALVILSHLLVSGLTFLNPEYEGSLVPSYIIMMLMGTWAFVTAGSSLRNLKLRLMCRDKDFLLANQHPR